LFLLIHTFAHGNSSSWVKADRRVGIILEVLVINARVTLRHRSQTPAADRVALISPDASGVDET
jgi:hypothetical protein